MRGRQVSPLATDSFGCMQEDGQAGCPLHTQTGSAAPQALPTARCTAPRWKPPPNHRTRPRLFPSPFDSVGLSVDRGPIATGIAPGTALFTAPLPLPSVQAPSRSAGPIDEPDWLSLLWDWKAQLMDTYTRKPQTEQQEGGNDTL